MASLSNWTFFNFEIYSWAKKLKSVFKLFCIVEYREKLREIRKIFKLIINGFIMRKGKKITGGRYKKSKKKKLYELKRTQRFVLLGQEKKTKIKIRNGKRKNIFLKANKANVIDPKTHKAKVVEIKNVLEVPSNKFLARKNIIVKGAIIETELGKARVTNRPSQEGQVNAVLI